MRALFVFGTRPEAIKLAPLVHTFRDHHEVKVCVTAQHRQMLDQVLHLFKLVPDFDLEVMKPGQNLSELTAVILAKMQHVLLQWRPDLVVVQGDTTSAMAAAMAAFYNKIPIVHVEAGLRSHDLYSPFPEEFNRQIVSKIAAWHFCPTERNKQNLLAENVPASNIFVTGNTVIDALFWTLRNSKVNIRELLNLDAAKKIILVTGHRRESFGAGFRNICEALYQLAHKHPDVQIVYPVHLNPNVITPVKKKLSNIDNIHLIEPLDYEKFAHLMKEAYLILTDSGGIQEEAPSLGIPVLVMRDVTERQEAIECGVAKLVGTEVDKIVTTASILLQDFSAYQKMANTANPYGLGNACEIILDIMNSVRSEAFA